MWANRYIAFYKPWGVLSQFSGAEGQDTLANFGLPKGVYAAGRLDRDSEGLLILSDDGSFIHSLLSPLQAHPRRYYAQVEGSITEAALEQFRQGVIIKGGYQTRPCLVQRLGVPPSLPVRRPPVRYRARIPDSWVELTLNEGKNRQVRRMAAGVGFPVLRLVRVSIGRLSLWDIFGELDVALWPGRQVQVERQQILKTRRSNKR